MTAEHHTDPVVFLKLLRPDGPWMLLAIEPDGDDSGIEAITAETSDEIRKFVTRHYGKRNIYYSVNPTRKPMRKKAAKTDISVIEYVPADLDPKPDETPEAAKARYFAGMEDLQLTPTAIIDSGNGLNLLMKLREPIPLDEPIFVTNKTGCQVKVFAAATQKLIDDVEGRARLLMQKLGSIAGTQNIDRILRLPGTINLPNKKKLKDGRTPCPAELIKFNGATFGITDFPEPPPATSAPMGLVNHPKRHWSRGTPTRELPKQMCDLLLIADQGAGEKHGKNDEYESRSGVLFAFLLGCLNANVNIDVVHNACLDDKYRGKAIYQHCNDQSNPVEYLDRQMDRAEEKYIPPMTPDDRAAIGAQIRKALEAAGFDVDAPYNATLTSSRGNSKSGPTPAAPAAPAKDDGAPPWIGEMLRIPDIGFGLTTTIFTFETGEDYGPYKSCKHLLSDFLARCVKCGIADEMIIGLCLDEHKFSDGLICSYCRENNFTREELETRIKDARQVTPQGTTISSEGLGAMAFEPIKYVIPDLIVEGLTLLAGKPKLGKSWLLMHAAIAVATGGTTLGGLQCEQGDVLYCALEDNLRRLQSRLDKLLPGVARTDWPPRLFLRTEMPRLTDGGLDEIRAWIKAAIRPRLIVIDTLAMVRPAKGREETGYYADYNAVKDLRTLAGEYGVAIVIVHHLRKQEAEDAFDTVSGTLGLTGAPDSILVVRYDTAGVVLHGRGRDLVELEKALVFDKFACTWSIKGDADDVRRSAERDAILTALMEGAGDPLGARQVAEVIGMKAANVRKLLGKMAVRGEIKKVGYGKYTSIGGPKVSKEFVEGLHRAQANGGGKPETAEAEAEAEPEVEPEAEAENTAAAAENTDAAE